MRMQQRVMVDVCGIDTSVNVFGESWSMPLALAPVGLAGMMARRGELQAKKAADDAGIPYCLSTVSICSLEEVAGLAQRPFRLQLYMLRDRGTVRELLQRASDVGVTTLAFTIDLARRLHRPARRAGVEAPGPSDEISRRLCAGEPAAVARGAE